MNKTTTQRPTRATKHATRATQRDPRAPKRTICAERRTTCAERRTTRIERRGMPLSEWRRQNMLPRPPRHGITPDERALIERLWQADDCKGIQLRTLARLYFPHHADDRSAASQLSRELRRCRDLATALDRLHHHKGQRRFTCAQVEELFLFYGSP